MKTRQPPTALSPDPPAQMRGYSGFKRFLLGSVSHKVAAEADCSGRIARPRRHRARSWLRVAVVLDESPRPKP
ncbi:MAG: hypothetical protein FJ387_25205 [Verrucomicrobia bacterium]|nr:hypothetical protein [Verrucomicrobiota bacterium]